jgi:monoterpene epsilon-lactone hydrolase
LRVTLLGGGLALSLLSLVVAEAHEGPRVRPAGAAVISPWTDLALSGASMGTRAEADPLVTKESLAGAARIYLSEHDPCDPRTSPLYADLAGLPPLRIHVDIGGFLRQQCAATIGFSTRESG